MRRKLVSLLLVGLVVSVASGAAMWQPLATDTDPLSALTNEQAALLSQVMFDDDPECPDLTDPFAPPNRLLCELNCRIVYLLGGSTCSEYVDCWLDCQGIPN